MKIRTARRLVCLLLAVPMTMALLPVRAEAQRTPSGGPVVIVRPPPPKGLAFEMVGSMQRTESGRPVSFALTCPAGKAAISGGVQHVNGMPKGHFHIINSYPYFALVGQVTEKYPSQWRFTVINDTTPGMVVYIYYNAVCINPVPDDN